MTIGPVGEDALDPTFSDQDIVFPLSEMLCVGPVFNVGHVSCAVGRSGGTLPLPPTVEPPLAPEAPLDPDGPLDPELPVDAELPPDLVPLPEPPVEPEDRVPLDTLPLAPLDPDPVPELPDAPDDPDSAPLPPDVPPAFEPVPPKPAPVPPLGVGADEPHDVSQPNPTASAMIVATRRPPFVPIRFIALSQVKSMRGSCPTSSRTLLRPIGIARSVAWLHGPRLPWARWFAASLHRGPGRAA